MASSTRIALGTDVRVDAAAPMAQRLVWDLPLRITHWLLVLAVLGSYVSYKLGLAYFKYHVWCGYTVLMLAAFRILWGVLGTRHARFASFVRGPAATLRHAADLARGRARRHAGHNPLGAWMVLALLGGLLAQALTGLFSNDEIASTGPLYGTVSNALSLKLTSVHRLLFDGLAVAIALHVAAVLAYQLLKKDPLIRAMFTGRKPATEVAAEELIRSSRLWLAAALVALLIVALVLVVAHAPAAGPSFD